MNTKILIVSLTFLMTGFVQMQALAQSEPTVELKNPIIPGYFADPSIVQYDGKFYLYATADPWGKDFLACWVSDDFQNWSFHQLNYPTKALCTSPTSNENNVWAPSVVKKGDNFYMYVSVGSEVWCGKARHPLGPWENMPGNKPLIPYDTSKYYHVIDAEVFIDDDGRAYLYWGSGWEWINGHCFAAELNDDMSSFKTKPVEVTPKNYFEGPFMLKHGGKYFLTYSDGKTIDSTYKVRYAVGDNPFGPFVEAPNSPILETNDDLQVYGPGHHTFFRFRGKNYILYHRHSLPFVEGTANRQICINEFEFDDEKGLIKKIVPSNTQEFPNMAKSKNDYKLIWSDEFDAEGAPNPDFWNYENGFVRNEEYQWYQPENAVCHNGILTIFGKKEQIPNPKYEKESRDWRKNRQYAEYTSACIKTDGKKEFLYGRFEVRAKIPTASGSWPAIWTLGKFMPWPSNGEIDIMEYYPIKGVPHILANTAWGTDKPNNAKWDSETVPFSKFTEKDTQWADKFHVWRMDWDEEAIRLYLDDELLNETLLSETQNGSIGNYANPFRQPHYILLNLAIGGQNGGTPDDAAFPLKYEIDYVRVYQMINK